MNDIFTPSLILSLGPSARKALALSEKFLACLPQHFKNVIGYYNIEEASNARNDIQSIIDDRLLSAKNLNRLVDIGFKVRNHSASPVRLNIYLLWDVYSSTVSGHEIIKLITELNYGNVDKELHTGATVLIMPILDKEWKQDRKTAAEAVSQLKNTISHISKQDMMLVMDSKVYMLHTVSSDGSRISMEELEYICAMLIYLTVVPSEDPPLLHFNRRLIKEEGRYKIGTVGITSLTLLMESFIERLSRVMAEDMLRYAVTNYAEEIQLSSKVSEMLSYEYQRDKLEAYINTTDLESYISEYNKVVCEAIESEIGCIIEEHGLRAGEKYLKNLEKELGKEKNGNEPPLKILSKIEEENLWDKDLEEPVENSKHYHGVFKIFTDRFNKKKRIDAIISEYRRNVAEEAGREQSTDEKDINEKLNKEKSGEDKSIIDNNRQLSLEIEKLKKDLEACTANVMGAANKANVEEDVDNASGGLITPLTNLVDCDVYYKEYSPKVAELYKLFIHEHGDYKKFSEPDIYESALRFVRRQITENISMDGKNLLEKIYDVNADKQLAQWIRNGLVKTQYLLQHTGGENLEEHSLFLACAELSDIVKNILSKEYTSLYLSSAGGINTYVNCISIIKLCFGIDFERISQIKNLRKLEHNNGT